MKTLAQQIAAHRHSIKTKAGEPLSQAAYAKRYGFPLGSLRNWEQGLSMPRAPQMWRLVKLMGAKK